MDTKLTLKLNNKVIKRAKMYAHQQNTSLSKVIESYLKLLTNPSINNEEITPLVKSLSGIINGQADQKKAYKKHLVEKYGK